MNNAITALTSAQFQSTPSARRATPPGLQHGLHVQFQSTPSARRATVSAYISAMMNRISIHALREEGDHPRVFHRTAASKFQSTPSARRATKIFRIRTDQYIISIHALREEGDPAASTPSCVLSAFQSTPSARRATQSGCCRHLPAQNFNPRPPRGGRQSLLDRLEAKGEFQSTPSARRATLRATSSPCFITYFNPRPPRGGRRHSLSRRSSPSPISIHALREEGDHEWREERLHKVEFQSTPSARRAT